MAAPPLLTLQDAALTFGGTPLISRADLTIAPGDRTCLVGRNGSGKSTLMKIAAGLAEPDKGRHGDWGRCKPPARCEAPQGF